MLYRRLPHGLLTVLLFLALIFSAFPGVSIVQAAPPAQPAAGGPPRGDAPPPGLAAPAAQPASSAAVRVIVGLAEPSLAEYQGGINGFAATAASATGQRRLDVNSPQSQAYLAHLNASQQAVIDAIARNVAGAQVFNRYSIVFNGLAVKVAGNRLDDLRKLPGVVSVTPERAYQQQMDTSLALIGLGGPAGRVGYPDWTDSGLWGFLGGHDKAGVGIKVADIDSGITPSNPCFNPTGYTFPPGFPKYDLGGGRNYQQYTNPKIIAARAYFRLDDPPVHPPTPLDDPENGHGTHTAGTIACDYGTQTPFSGLRISGVAPKAQLMVYRVFYLSVTGSESAFDPELMRAVEDAVADGADVINNSWGGTALSTVTDDPLVRAYTAAVNAGVVVVFSAGNEGPGTATVGSPAIGQSFISVGASTTSRTFTATVTAVSATPPSITIPANVKNISGRSVLTQTVTAPTVDLRVEGYADPLACPLNTPGYPGAKGPLPSALVAGKIVVIERGVCALVDKVKMAKEGGAVGVILRNVTGGATTLPLISPVLPTAHVSAAEGNAIRDFLTTVKAAGGTATFSIIGPAHVAFTDPPDTIASFSSQGPTPNFDIAPDIVAPGVNILSSVSYPPGFDFFQGTSMAAPHVAGAAALLRQVHPDWRPVDIKSALMSTAAQPASLGANPTIRGAGRLDLSTGAHPWDPGLTFDHPSLTFGATLVGKTYTVTVQARNTTGAAETYTITPAAATGGFAPTVTPATINVPANGTATFQVVLQAGQAGLAYGELNLNGTTHRLHIPYWTNRLAGLAAAEVLLVNDSMGPTGSNCPDVGPYYRNALNNLGKTHAEWLVSDRGPFDWNVASQYSKVIYFQGYPGCGGSIVGQSNAVRNYLANGGRLIAFGQDFANFYSQAGAGSDLALFFGATFVQNNLYGTAARVPQPTAQGTPDFSPYMAGQAYDLSTRGNGEGDQSSVDEVRAAFFTDTDAVPILRTGPVTTTMGTGDLGTRQSSEPTIERIKGTGQWTHLGWRSELVTFGLEGINDNTGFSTRRELLDRLTAFLDDQVTVSFTGPTPFAGSGPFVPITLTAKASTTVTRTATGLTNRIEYYRWDFGDGTAPQMTTGPSVVHAYAANGNYNAYVEVMDTFGHKAVSALAPVQVGPHRIYMPFVPVKR